MNSAIENEMLTFLSLHLQITQKASEADFFLFHKREQQKLDIKNEICRKVDGKEKFFGSDEDLGPPLQNNYTSVNPWKPQAQVNNSNATLSVSRISQSMMIRTGT